jgi:hypothetical protein
MSKIINIKIDLTKIDKSKLFTSETTGAKYLDATVFVNDVADQYGQFGMITQDVTKEEREAGEKGAILGNVRRVFDKDTPTKPVTSRVATVHDDGDVSLPF